MQKLAVTDPKHSNALGLSSNLPLENGLESTFIILSGLSDPKSQSVAAFWKNDVGVLFDVDGDVGGDTTQLQVLVVFEVTQDFKSSKIQEGHGVLMTFVEAWLRIHSKE